MTEPPSGPGEGPPAGAPRVRPFLNDAPTAPDPPPDDAPAPLRPYVLTAGRVRGDDASIGLESQVSSRDVRSAVPLSREMQAIVASCSEPLSVAEISARVRIHLGVARILVGDLHAAGLVDVRGADEHQANDPDVILRVIRGLRTIS